MLSRDSDLCLNRLAQGLDSMDDGVAWFATFDDLVQQALLQKLGMFALQAGARVEDVGPAILNAQLKATFTPCVLLALPNLKDQLARIARLPQSERVKSFRLLVSLLSIADGRRRRERCAGGCDHWWHQLEPT